MAHFAELDENNKVIRVIVVNNNELLVDGVEQEEKGITFCQTLLGGNWKQTSYNASFRKHYTATNYTYDEQRDAFIPPQPYASWSLNEETCDWDPPTPFPNDGKYYRWDEYTLSWIVEE
jgi:hypothetical protein